MTPAEIEMAIRLSHCSFAPGSYDKRFARDVGAAARAGEWPQPTITEAQAAELRRLTQRYRRQIPRVGGGVIAVLRNVSGRSLGRITVIRDHASGAVMIRWVGKTRWAGSIDDLRVALDLWTDDATARPEWLDAEDIAALQQQILAHIAAQRAEEPSESAAPAGQMLLPWSAP